MKSKVKKELFILLAVIDIVVIYIGLHFGIVQSNAYEGSLGKAILYDIVRYPISVLPSPTAWLIPTVPTLTALAYLVISTDVKRKAIYDSKTVHGAAKWYKDIEGFNRRFNAPYGEKTNSGQDNMIVSQNYSLGYNNEKVRRNSNMFIIGGAGTGKSFGIVGPNILQMNTSMVITDPSGELYAKYGRGLEYNGYKVKKFDLETMEQGNKYNPFAYIDSPIDIMNLVRAILDNTKEEGSGGGDQFWTDCSELLLSALIAYMVETLPRTKRTFAHMMGMLSQAQVTENDNGQTSNGALDDLFNTLDQENPDSWAVIQYKAFKTAAGKTLQSILISVLSRLRTLTVDEVKQLTSKDEMELDKIGDERTALFICIPTGLKAFNFLASMMYTQLFQTNYAYAMNDAQYSQCMIDSEGSIWKTFRATPETLTEVKKEANDYFACVCEHAYVKPNKVMDWWEIRMPYQEDDILVGFRGSREEAEHALERLKKGRIMPNSEQTHDGARLPIHLTMIMDEFANTGRVPNFPEYVATIRKFDISVMIFLQSITQAQQMYDKEWSGIAGNCDTLVGLGGGADTETAEYFEKLLGSETRRTLNVSYNGKSGGNESYSSSGEKLLSAADYRTIPDNKCIVVFRGLDGIKDDKYNVNRHPNMKQSKTLRADFGPYVYNAEKVAYLYQEQHKEGAVGEKHGHVVDGTAEPEDASTGKDDAEALGGNKNPDGSPVVTPPENVNPETGEIESPEPKKVDLNFQSESEGNRMLQASVEKMDEFLHNMEFSFETFASE